MATHAQVAAPTNCHASADAAERHVFVVCDGENCRNAGATGLIALLRHVYTHATRNHQDLRVGSSRCLGHCASAPAMMADGRLMSWVSLRRLRSELMRFGLAANTEQDA